jgi:hypothetical protein
MSVEETIVPAGVADAGEILTVQRAAYLTEAQHYADPFLPPLTAIEAACAGRAARFTPNGIRLAVLEKPVTPPRSDA